MTELEMVSTMESKSAIRLCNDTDDVSTVVELTKHRWVK